MLESIEPGVERGILEAECAREVDDAHARFEDAGSELERGLRGGGEEDHRALARELPALLLRRVLELSGRPAQAGAAGGGLAGPLVAAQELELHPRMQREDAAELEPAVPRSADDPDRNALHSTAYLCKRALRASLNISERRPAIRLAAVLIDGAVGAGQSPGVRGRTLAGTGRISFHSHKAARWQATTSR